MKNKVIWLHALTKCAALACVYKQSYCAFRALKLSGDYISPALTLKNPWFFF